MGSDKQRLEALETFVQAMAANTVGLAAGGVLWGLVLPAGAVLFGIGLVFMVTSAWDYYIYLKAKYQ